MQAPPGITSVSAPPGLGMPPGLSGNNNQQQHSYMMQQQQQQQQQHGMHSNSHLSGGGIPPQPDLSSIGPHTSNAQLAALLASVGNQGPDLTNGGGGSSAFGQQSQQQQQGGGGNNGGFSSTFGNQSGGSSGWGMSGGHGGMGGNGGNGGAQVHPCRMHQQGHCRYGQSCRFQHIGPPGSGGNGGGFSKFGGGGGGSSHNAFGSGFGNQGAFGNNSFGNHQAQQQSHLSHHLQSNNSNNSFQMRTLPEQVSNSGNNNSNSNQDESKTSDVLGGSEVPATFPNSQASFPPAGQQQQQQQSAQAPTPSFAAAPIANPNAALLQALLMQQQLTASAGLPANPELDNLIVSLNKSQQQQQMAAAAAAAPVVAAPAPIVDQSLNQEFLLAQQSLASLALGGVSSRPQQQQPQQSSQQQQGGFNSYQNRNAPGGQFGSSQGPNMGNKYGQHQQSSQQSSYQPQSSSYGGGGNGGGHSHGQPLSGFHSGGNFGSNMNPAIIPQQMRFLSDASNRDLRREAELFGPAHTTTTGINFDKYDDIPVEVTGNDVPGEMKSFSDFDFPEVIRQNIELSKYLKPTPIQKFALPVAFLGRDLMACAQTGSGKTAAFLLPFIAHLVINGRPAPMGGSGRNKRYMPVGLILAPTRELATQIHEESLKFTYCTSIHSVVVYGGQDIRMQFRELDRGVDVIIGTPGRLMDFVERGRISLSQISYLCLDEADRMLDMGFEPQIRNIVMQQDMSENRQTLMFSATFPKEIQRLAQDFLYNYIFIAVGRVGASSDFITQSVEWVDEENKRVQVMQLLPNFKGLTLIFVERKKSADLLETYLNREGFHASSIHGDRSQHERETALAQFRNGRCPILVATDVAARGLDIPNVLDVVNFDMPSSIDDYVHRIGRTGRAGNTGNAWSFVNEKSNHLFKELYEMLHENKQVVPAWLTQIVETSGRGGMQRGGGGGGGKRFGGKDYRTKAGPTAGGRHEKNQKNTKNNPCVSAQTTRRQVGDR